MCKLEGFENLVNDYLINNTNYDEPFANFEIYESILKKTVDKNENL